MPLALYASIKSLQEILSKLSLCWTNPRWQFSQITKLLHEKAIMESGHVSVSGNANDFAIRSPAPGSFIGHSFYIITISSTYTVCKTNLYIL
uniref:Uncharacterized protein n=1 Tax=Salix viminalis TaxID=40686 RepID=A0A6N2K2K2_SALVM